jgi:glycosyltransferase involved in cell wall biosynthesis
MEQLLAALSQTGQVRIAAVSWAPLGLGLPGIREVIPMQRPNLGGLSATLWKLWFDQWYSLRAISGRDGVLVHGMDGFLPYSLRSRDRAVTTVHDLGWHVHPELFDRRVRLMYNALFPWVRRRSDRFIAVSRYTADDLMRSAGVPASRIEVIYHGLDPIFSSSEEQKPEPASSPYLLAMGGISPARKNTRRLIEAFTRWRSRGGHRSAYRLLLTGVSLERYFQQNGEAVPEGVSLAGYVEKSALPQLYAGAAAVLYPGIYEGFGLPIIESMACGTPVVTSSTGAAPEIAGGAAILVDPFDLEDIVDGIERVTTPGEAERLRTLGYERSRLFNWSSAAARTVEVYRQLVP